MEVQATDGEIITVANLEKLELKEQDLLVVQSRRPLQPTEMRQLNLWAVNLNKQMHKAKIATNVIVLPYDFDMKVLRPASLANEVAISKDQVERPGDGDAEQTPGEH